MGASASREKFRESVSSLIEVDVSPDDADFWDELWKIPSSAEEVFELISPQAARKLRDERFENLATLFTQATAQLCQIVETPYNIYFDQALNCVRVLTRILPFLLEKGGNALSDPNVETLCWGTGTHPNTDPIVGKVICGENDGVPESLGKVDSSHDDDTNNTEDDAQEPLGLLVVHAAFHMLFLPQFTCDFYEEDKVNGRLLPAVSSIGKVALSKRLQGSHADQTEFEGNSKLTADQIHDKKVEAERNAKKERAMKLEAGLKEAKIVDSGLSLLPKPSTIIWAHGCGVSPSPHIHEGGTRKFDKNRVEVLRLVLAACSDPLFSTANNFNPLVSRWLAVAVSSDTPNSICLFYSLLNTILTYDPRGSVAYSSAFASDTHVKLVELSVQVLCVLLDYGIPGNANPVKNINGEPLVETEEVSKTGFNIFRTLLARIDSGKQLSFMFRGFCRLLKSVHENKNALLPANSSKRLQCFQELLVLLWKCIEENPLFMKYIVTECDITEIVVPICFMMYKSRRDQAQVGLMHICTFILLKLSGERSFGVNLSKMFKTSLPCDIPLFTGGHCDLLCITLHKLVVNGCSKLIPLYSCFITIIGNISPYWRFMSLVAAMKLVNLFEFFSAPKFFYSTGTAYRHVALMLEIFNNVIQYQYYGNEHLVYAVIRKKDSFKRLAHLSLEKAIEECEKLNCEKKWMQSISDVTQDQKLVISLKEVSGQGKVSTKEMNDGLLNSYRLCSTDESADDDVITASVEFFCPTEHWIREVAAALSTETVNRLLNHLIPAVDEIIYTNQGAVDEGDLLVALRNITMVGLLPVPHAIVVRKYQPNQFTSLWFTSFLWGVIFLRNQSPPIFDGEGVALFHVDKT